MVALVQARQAMQRSVGQTFSQLRAGSPAATMPASSRLIAGRVLDAHAGTQLVSLLKEFASESGYMMHRTSYQVDKDFSNAVQRFAADEAMTTLMIDSAISKMATVLLGQADIDAALSGREVAVASYVKDQPVLGFKILGGLQDIPAVLHGHMGDVDETTYSPEWFTANQGSVVTLQMSGAKADFYPQALENFEKKYRVVDRGEVAAKNARMLQRMGALDGMKSLLDNDDRVIGMLRTTPSTMYRFADVFAVDAGLGVDVSVPAWGGMSTQSIPASQQAFLVYEALKHDAEWNVTAHHHYVVNQGENGLPIGYIPQS